MPKLIDDSSCKLIFSHKSCQIQDNTTFKTIGQADLHGGLYCLHDPVNIHEEKYLMNCNVLNSKENDIDLWHFRLGHPSKHVVEQVCKTFPYVNSSSDKLCDIHLAKQHKLPFQISNTVSLNTFDLIHIDI